MTQPYRRTQPITDALYGRDRKARRHAPPRKDVNPRHSFDVAGQLDADTRNKLAALQGRLEKAQGRRRRKGAR